MHRLIPIPKTLSLHLILNCTPKVSNFFQASVYLEVVAFVSERTRNLSIVFTRHLGMLIVFITFLALPTYIFFTFERPLEEFFAYLIPLSGIGAFFVSYIFRKSSFWVLSLPYLAFSIYLIVEGSGLYTGEYWDWARPTLVLTITIYFLIVIPCAFLGDRTSKKRT